MTPKTGIFLLRNPNEKMPENAVDFYIWRRYDEWYKNNIYLDTFVMIQKILTRILTKKCRLYHIPLLCRYKIYQESTQKIHILFSTMNDWTDNSTTTVAYFGNVYLVQKRIQNVDRDKHSPENPLSAIFDCLYSMWTYILSFIFCKRNRLGFWKWTFIKCPFLNRWP